VSGVQDDASDLIGDMSGSNQTEAGNNSQGADAGALQAINSGVQAAKPGSDEDKKQRATEEALIKRYMCEYRTGRSFDRSTHASFAKDRQYAAGMADPRWASDAPLIATFIDILVSFLYAQNPDVGARPARKVEAQPDKNSTDLAETMELVISKLWMMSDLKTSVRSMVRSTLTVGQGWFKATMWSKKRPQPQVEKRIHDMEEQISYLHELKRVAQEDPNTDTDAAIGMIQMALTGLRAKTMLEKEHGINIDFVRAEDVQTSLDIAASSSYKSGDWMSEDIYVPVESLRERFDRLEKEDIDGVTAYYQRNIPANAKGDVLAAATGEEVYAGQYTKTEPSNINAGGDADKPVKFGKVIEFWDRRDNMIKTMIEGVKRWAVEPYPPNQATIRFFPYFRLSFYEVDGQRHPHSLTFRLRKLADEYAACRSNQRLTRERCIPGTIFNAGAMDEKDARKLEQSVIGEMVGINPTNPETPIQNIVMEKKLPQVNPALWDSTAIITDMERVSGVQEAMQQAMTQQPKTATEAQIQQSGFASRTGADRDTLEDVLGDLAVYTAQCAIQECDPLWVQRVCGPLAFWPYGMDVQDLLTMVEVELQAGTTGKPNLAAEKANWATILPLLEKLMLQIRQVSLTDPPMAEALENLLKESLRRMDDRLDIDQFIPSAPPPPPPPPAPPVPSVSVSLKGVVDPVDALAISQHAAGEIIPPGGGVPPLGAPAPAPAVPEAKPPTGAQH
jgi:hypothetical protein